MEDITLEDGNYGTFVGAGLCYSSSVLTSIDSPYPLSVAIKVEYQSAPSMKWKPALYEQSVVERLLAEQFHQYVDRVKKTDCQAELRRLLAQGPPVFVEDKHALPLEEGDTHVVKLWFASDNEERSAKLDGAPEGEEREALWKELKEFIIVEGKEEGDEDDGGDAGEAK